MKSKKQEGIIASYSPDNKPIENLEQLTLQYYTKKSINIIN